MNPLERLWKDRMDIYRYKDGVVNGVTKSKEEKAHSNIKCHYSKGSLTDTGSDGVPKLVNNHKLFCSLETDLQEGDKIVVTQPNGKQVILSVGEGFPFTYHMEFAVKRDETA